MDFTYSKSKLVIFITSLLIGSITIPYVSGAIVSGVVTAKGADCSKAEYQRCVALADPLIREPSLIFPDNMDDIDSVCRTWNQFVDCLKRYIDNCFTEQQRRQFNKAVENPIESVHQMCTQTSYQKEYLRHAACIKSTVTEVAHCGPQYALLVEQVSRGDAIARTSLCCSHHRFKQCVITETRRVCDGGNPEGDAARFSAHTIDKALSFLADQCHNYIPNSGDCPLTSTTMDQLYTSATLHNDVRTSWNAVSSRDASGSPTGSPAQNNFQQGVEHPIEHEREAISSTRDVMFRHSTGSIDAMQMSDHSTEVSWMPGGSGSKDATQMSIIPSGRTRPSSYGRSSSWTPSPQTTVRPDWVSSSTWHDYTKDVNEKFDSQTETWYPAAGSYGNSIDEPNQQGLSKLPNSSANVLSVTICLAAIATVILNLL